MIFHPSVWNFSSQTFAHCYCLSLSISHLESVSRWMWLRLGFLLISSASVDSTQLIQGEKNFSVSVSLSLFYFMPRYVSLFILHRKYLFAKRQYYSVKKRASYIQFIFLDIQTTMTTTTTTKTLNVTLRMEV